jgi:hypothetical protein
MSLTGNFIPGSATNRQRQRQIMNRYSQEITRLQANLVSGGDSDYFCECFQEKVDSHKSGYRTSEQSRSMRISDLVTTPLGGRTVFGQGYVEPVVLPRRNKF